MWDVIAAKGFEKDMYFESAGARHPGAAEARGNRARQHRADRQVHGRTTSSTRSRCPRSARRDDDANDDFLFDQGPTRGLGKIKFHDYRPAFERVRPSAERGDVHASRSRSSASCCHRHTDRGPAARHRLPARARPAVRADRLRELALENAPVYSIPDELVDEIFGVFVRDFSQYALDLHGKAATSHAQADLCLGMLRRPVADEDRYAAVWQQVQALDGAYAMNR